MRAEDQIHEAIALSDLLHYSLLLHHAAAERDNHPRMLLLQAVQVAQAAIDTQIRVLANRAGIIKDEIRILVRAFLKTNLLQDSNQLLGISGIHLAAERRHASSQRASNLRLLLLYELLHLRDIVALALLLFQRRMAVYVDLVRHSCLCHLVCSLSPVYFKKPFSVRTRSTRRSNTSVGRCS